MRPAGDYVADAYGLPRGAFERRHGRLFFVHVAPAQEAASGNDISDEWAVDIGYQTSFGPNPGLLSPEVEAAVNAVRDFRVSEVRKREGNPFPERIRIGRARNSDVVLRYGYVSKLHAHIVSLDPDRLPDGTGPIAVVDQRSHNGTFVNGRRVEAGEAVQVEVGDEISFGSLRVRVMDAERVIGFLKRESQRPRGLAEA